MIAADAATLRGQFDAVVFDVGGTLVAEASAATPLSEIQAVPLPDVTAVLDALAGAGLALAAVTNTAVMGESEVRRLLAAAGIHHLDVIVTSVDVGAAKPDPAALTLALERLDVPAGRALYVGDRESDRAAALAAGAGFVATDRGVADALARTAAPAGPFTRAAARVGPLDGGAVAAARARHDRLTKPPGSLGRLEDLAAQLAGIAGACPPPTPTRPVVGIFAADHGVVASGVTPWPQAVTGQMLANFVAGGAAINAIARQVGAAVHVVDVGVAGGTATPGVENRRIRPGTADLAHGPAMGAVDVCGALDAGAEVAAALVAAGHDLLATGDMGIGNTTASAALIAALTRRDPASVTGRGTGIDDVMLDHKTAVVGAAVARTTGYLDPRSILAEVGGLEIAALAGFVVGGAAARVPVVVDGVIALAALCVADALVPGVADHSIAGHRSPEPAATAALEHLGLEPVLDLGLRLGEGTGACLAVPVVQVAARLLAEMATFDEAAVADDPRAG